MNQPYEIPYSIPYTPQETREDLLRAFDSGIISGSGPAVSEVESLLAARLGMSKSYRIKRFRSYQIGPSSGKNPPWNEGGAARMGFPCGRKYSLFDGCKIGI